MKLSREKINHLSLLIVNSLAEDSSITFRQPRNDVRLKVVDVLRRAMEREEQIEQTARQRILSMKKDVPEGSEEWDILFDKYYREESEKESKIR